MTEKDRVNYPAEMELDVASKIMAGFAANPAIFASNSQNGWALVNCTDEELSLFAKHLARTLISVCDGRPR